MDPSDLSADLAILLRDPNEHLNTTIYKPLDKERSEIRLLTTWIDSDTDRLHGTIQYASLHHKAIEYEALSYRWGAAVDQRIFNYSKTFQAFC